MGVPKQMPETGANMKTIEQRFWSKVNKDGPTAPHMDTPCWLWTASKRNKGYGAFAYTLDGVMVQDRAHRYSYQLHIGTIPPGLFVLHRCDTPACVNPDHLFLGTNQDNVTDMYSKGRGTYPGDGTREINWERGEEHHAAKLTEDRVRELRALHATGGWSYSQLGRRFGIGAPCAYKIAKRLLWKHVL